MCCAAGFNRFPTVDDLGNGEAGAVLERYGGVVAPLQIRHDRGLQVPMREADCRRS